ncbi:MAG: LON peptidase substrate-binding domain-containing protein, partial [Bacteroidia bacterium]
MTFNEDDSEFIPIMSFNEEEDPSLDEAYQKPVPILPLRNTVLFPGVVIPITVGRDKSIRLIREANNKTKTIGVMSQRDVTIEDPGADDLHKIGTLARILKMLRMPDGNTTVIIQGRQRFELQEVVQQEPYLKAHLTPNPDLLPNPKNKEFNALISTIKD